MPASLPPPATIRRAQPSEAALLTDLALAAKAHWGYSPAFMSAARAELTISACSITEHDVHVAILPNDAEIAGVYRLTPGDIGELSYLWIRPAHIGRGLGRLLWEDALRRAAAGGMVRLTLDADPNAEGFYLRMGAQRCGETPSKSVEGRRLPLLTVDVHQALAMMRERESKAAA
ncbi:acetyltransferase [Cordyceps militaris CM01]|uniref:Acetyltransferase n=1 Tax=Cordyceps militaris (strain CM01) TaxID=983644 RepID=G3JMZ5_CORMM|nr:acetyltransferase [Cordyceps militaris CM01]EGX90177.1 acetyltransferase [Cordyceps militaris CM01]